LSREGHLSKVGDLVLVQDQPVKFALQPQQMSLADAVEC
jgi:hypothetical protein